MSSSWRSHRPASSLGQSSFDEGGDMRVERQHLLEERSELRAKIARLRVQAKRAARSSEQNPTFMTRLDREYRGVEQQIMRSRAQIKELEMSDEAARRLELEEEAKVLYQERLRLQEIQLQQQHELDRVKQEYEQLFVGQEDVAQSDIDAMEEKLARVEKSNQRLVERIRELKERRDQDGANFGDGASGARAEQLRAQIHAVEQETEEMERQMREADERHAKVMRQWRERAEREPWDEKRAACVVEGV